MTENCSRHFLPSILRFYQVCNPFKKLRRLATPAAATAEFAGTGFFERLFSFASGKPGNAKRSGGIEQSDMKEFIEDTQLRARESQNTECQSNIQE
ncbi:hypothetical protein [Pelodictyon phaeoclathratiforme]|uniref:hypothetical protein n=1 Tax=Pelodictyon phaeoclathratiforme TaxID=34090 RepID=UPI0002E340D1|nr:hypothetical protein [Pelodictyon phaeoclathratiforme]